ncbi:MAG: T9SS type A sorting domain-containing protein [Bacteroidales bacterium]|nr:T9SS type A sorting domain-containing protein [Bacteroidales bacterium]
MKKSIRTDFKLLNFLNRNLILAAILLAGILNVNAQTFTGKNKIYLIGQVTNNINGAPIKNHVVEITSDTTFEPSIYYTNKLVTDHEGYYYDTIEINHQKGALKVYSYDYLNNCHDTIVHYRFNWSEDIILFANFKLPVKPAITTYHANFNYQRDPGGQNYLEYQFYDNTNSQNIISWNWNFGDGQSSHTQNPLHIFPEPGLYRVKLTVTIESSLFHNPIQTTIVKIINVTAKSYFDMGGHVFADYFPIDKGEAYLYKIEDKDYVPIDTATFNGEFGFYYFFQLIEGEYLIKADLHHTSEFYNQFMSTYYSNKLHWEQADTIFHHAENFEYNISLVPNVQNMAGPGKISGDISFGFDPKNPVGPASYVEIILYDNENHPMDICHSNEYGEFELETLDLQMYYLHAEVTGKHTIPLLIELEEANQEITYVKITIGDYGVYGSVSSGINNTLFAGAVSQVFPNPTENTINLEIDLNLQSQMGYTIFNQQGNLVMEGQINPYDFSAFNLNVCPLQPGLYFIRISWGSNEAVRRFIKK